MSPAVSVETATVQSSVPKFERRSIEEKNGLSVGSEWMEYLLPRNRPAFVHYFRSVWAGSVFAVYHTESMLVCALACTGLAIWVFGVASSIAWLFGAWAAGLLLCLVVGGIRQGRTTCESGVYTYQRVLSGRGYVRDGQRIGPYDTVIDLHTGLTPLKGRFFERLAIERPLSQSIGEAAQRTYQGLLHDDLSLVANAMLGEGGILRERDIVRCRLYMHRRYVPWVEDYEVTEHELSEGGGYNRRWFARVVSYWIQLSAAGLRLSQIRRNLMFKPHKLFKVFPTRTYLIVPEEREAFIRKCIARGALGQEYLAMLS